MRSSLFDYEWQFLTQMITRIHYTASYEELCRLLLEDQLPTLTGAAAGLEIFQDV